MTADAADGSAAATPHVPAAPDPADPPAFPMARDCPFDPPPEYARLREQQPLSRVTLPTGPGAWLVTRYDHVRQVLSDPRVSSDRTRRGFPSVAQTTPEAAQQMTPSMLGMDPPEHTALRRSVLGEFTVKRVQAMRPRIQEIVDARLDAMLDGARPVDLVQALALPVPSLVICELLGVPYADRDFFQHQTTISLSHTATAEERRDAFVELGTYLDGLVTRAESDPGDDLIGRLAVKYREDGSHGHDDLVSLARLLLIAGHETTANMISLGTVALLENPDQLAALRADPSLAPQVVEELLRYFSIVDHLVARVALADMEVGGVPIRAGEGMLVLCASANRDGEAFERPDRLDTRRGARHHVAFGYGPHQCLGQNLARAELEIAYTTLFDRIPGLCLAVPFDDLEFKDDALVYGIRALPVTW